MTYFPILTELENRDGLLLPGIECSVVTQISNRIEALAASSDGVRPPDEARTIAPLLGVAEGAVDAAVRAMAESSGDALKSGIVSVLDSAAAVVRPVTTLPLTNDAREAVRIAEIVTRAERPILAWPTNSDRGLPEPVSKTDGFHAACVRPIRRYVRLAGEAERLTGARRAA